MPVLRSNAVHASLAIALSALLINIAAPVGGNWPLLAWIAFAPWLVSLSGLRWWSAGISGLLMGLASVIPLHWATFAAAVASSGWSGWMQQLITFGFFISYALPFAVFGAVDVSLQRRWQLSGPSWALLRAGLLASLICGMWAPFPYTPVVTIVSFTPILQVAGIGGEPLLLLLLLWPSAALASVYGESTPGLRRWKAVLPVAACVLIGYAYGRLHIAELDRAELAGAGVRLSALPLQLNLPPQGASAQILMRDRPGGRQSALELTRGALQRSAQCELVVWPETPLTIERSAPACAQGADLAASLGLPTLMQCYRPDGQQAQISAEWLSPDRAPAQWHGKSSLVPLYEQPMFGDGMIAAGQPGTVFELDSARRIIPALCYELHSRRHLRRGVFNGGNVVAHMASFAPFDRNPIDIWDQAMAQLRAIEFGIPILRAANRGPTGWIDAAGRARSLSARFGSGGECLEIWSPARPPSLFAYLSPLGACLPGVLVLAFGWLSMRKRRKAEPWLTSAAERRLVRWLVIRTIRIKQ